MTTAYMVPQSAIRADRWLTFFNIDEALVDVYAHVRALPSSATPEQSTARAYGNGLAYFRNWHYNEGQPLIDRALMTRYIAHLTHTGRGPSTIASKYLAPLRHLLDSLINQTIDFAHLPDAQMIHARAFVDDCRLALRQARSVKNPKPQTKSSQPALYRHGNRLTTLQVNTLLESVDTSSLIGLRDLAILYIGFTCGLRVAEIQRLTLNAFRPGPNTLEIVVRGKRSNIDPVPAPARALELCEAWADAYNEGLTPDDPRYITRDTPLWQPLLHHGNYHPLDLPGRPYDPASGMSTKAIGKMVKNRSQAALGFAISPHDMRRSLAAIGRAAGMELDQIQRTLRHSSIGTTQLYVGTLPDLSKALVTNYAQIGTNI